MPRFNKDTPTAFQNVGEERARELGRLGQKRQVENNRRRKTIRECLKMLGQMKCTPKEVEVIKRVFPDIDDEELTKNCLVSVAMYQKAAQGDTKAFGKITETTGEKTVVVAGDPENPVGGGVSIEKIKELKGLLESEE